MNRAQVLLPIDEQLRLTTCSREPISVPGAIQDHGVLLAADPDTLDITHVSENSARFLGRSPAELLGMPLTDVLDAATLVQLVGSPANEIRYVQEAAPAIGARRLDALCHRVGDHLIIELEPGQSVAQGELLRLLSTTIAELAEITTVPELVARAAAALRTITGFDRVMVYQFHPDHHGEVIADNHIDGMDDYLGLHFPASDIPAQARSLYLLSPSRTIVDNGTDGAALLARDPMLEYPLDLSHAQLRAVSPHHLGFMRNMGQAATLSFSLVNRNELVGLITCAHRDPRHLSYEIRRALTMLARQLTLQMAAIVETGRLKGQLELHGVRTQLTQQMHEHDDPVEGLVGGDVTLLSLLKADGVTISFAGESRSLGDTPPMENSHGLAALLRSRGDQSFVSAALREDDVSLAQLIPSMAGIVYVPLGSGDDYILWYRREVLQTVNWLGDQTADNRATPLSPRNSFTLWKQSVSDRSNSWDEGELFEAAAMRNDINDVLLRRTQARLAYQGLHDDLTGLPNRRQGLELLTAELTRHKAGICVTVLFVDIDRFKYINDSFGHAMGDAMIVAAGSRLRSLVRAKDMVARLGGDEFMVAIFDLEPREVEPIAQRIVTGFRQPLLVSEQIFHVAVSVGAATSAPGSTSKAQDLLREADTAMYVAKRQGGNQLALFQPGLRPEMVQRLEMEQALSYCLRRHELELHYQPIFRLDNGMVAGAEALLRWNRPDVGFTSPEQFIPILEETGFIIPVGSWVLNEALEQLGTWKRSGIVDSAFSMAINLSARQFSDPTLTSQISGAMKEHDVQPGDVTLEITETAAMSDRAEILHAVVSIANLGVGLSIDDFGTGYSSMSMLRSLPVTQLKVDRQFVASMMAGDRGDALAAAVVNLAHQFRLTCVAEGVENSTQLSQLRELGCDFVQGFYLGGSVNAEEFASRHRRI